MTTAFAPPPQPTARSGLRAATATASWGWGRPTALATQSSGSCTGSKVRAWYRRLHFSWHWLHTGAHSPFLWLLAVVSSHSRQPCCSEVVATLVQTSHPASAGRVVKHVEAGQEHSLALGEGGEVWAWGHGAYGQLGLGPRESTDRFCILRFCCCDLPLQTWDWKVILSGVECHRALLLWGQLPAPNALALPPLPLTMAVSIPTPQS